MTFLEYIQQLSQDKLIYFALPVFFISMFVEFKIAKEKYHSKDTSVSLLMMIFSAIVEFIPKVLAFIVFFYLYQISPLNGVVNRQWWAWLLLFFADDFSYYWFHRLNHEVRLFWAGHVPHHSSIHMNLGTALRQGVGERIHKFFFWLWIPLLGFDPLMMFTLMGVSLIYQFFVHTELVDKLPKPIEFIFNTPSHHRVHHASNIRYLDCNHAGVLIIWDRIFGTFSEEMKEIDHPVYGLTVNIETYNPITVATHEYTAIWKDVKRVKKWSDKLNYIFNSPGWSHDGEDKRAKVLRKKLKEQENDRH
ncbi:sterol desaturase/sphingolipid hydroxylase (fatty acid hydroxylase superfamily) [Tenacibaculum skagerrakense]|uniref:Sterol desaturase/sphingolipid hydroxylase (Fatty acid hydroxylase superfamily) n=1 Tax=Tenacibaculum skagerrakense TaxID=186571 RepID=A0A4R2P2G5_9FLAO|nr:sterol desaturase family protein [Tenacibaculum skagerrakense]TCP28071.1 sterol desaturase/sphingolipid hydroxylase (fatty acid hydroxylase superfamily) [Tenacibaculum skagerrakense]